MNSPLWSWTMNPYETLERLHKKLELGEEYAERVRKKLEHLKASKLAGEDAKATIGSLQEVLDYLTIEQDNMRTELREIEMQLQEVLN